MHYGAKLEDGRAVTLELCERYIAAELERAMGTVDSNRYRANEQAATLMRKLIREQRFCEFLTLPAHRRMISAESTAT